MVNFKKIVLATALVAGTVGMAQAGPFKFGIKAGLNVNKISLSKDFVNKLGEDGNSCGWTAGVMADFTVPIIGVGADVSLMYSRMNNGAEEADLYGKNFLEIPINVKYKFTIPVVASVFKPYVFTGPQFGLRLDKKGEYSFTDQASNAIVQLQSRTFQMNWNVGLGVEFINHLQISASYAIGCNKIVKDIVNSTTPINIDYGKVKNNYWTVTAAWLF